MSVFGFEHEASSFSPLYVALLSLVVVQSMSKQESHWFYGHFDTSGLGLHSSLQRCTQSAARAAADVGVTLELGVTAA